MDEIDAVGRHRGAGLGGGHDEREQTLNQLLVEMDGFEAKDNIILIAATNRPDILDPALLRPGRFDRQIVVDRPDRDGRAQILAVHTKGKPIAKQIDLQTLAGQTPGFTGADIANLVNEAALLAARKGKRLIEQAELEEGIMRVIAGPEKKSRLLSEKERVVTAYHEMGHALVGHFLPNADPVHKISVVSRGQALGYTISMPDEDKFLTTRAQLEDGMAMTLGGRAAEEIVFDEITTGAANDLEKVTQTAKQMTMRFGMSDKLGPRVLGHNQGAPFLGRDMHSEPDYSRRHGPRDRRRDPAHHRGGPPARPRHPGRAPRPSSRRSRGSCCGARRSSARSSWPCWPAARRRRCSPSATGATPRSRPSQSAPTSSPSARSACPTRPPGTRSRRASRGAGRRRASRGPPPGDEGVGGERAVEHLPRLLTSGHGQPGRVEGAHLDEDGRLVPVDVLVGDPAVRHPHDRGHRKLHRPAARHDAGQHEVHLDVVGEAHDQLVDDLVLARPCATRGRPSCRPAIGG